MGMANSDEDDELEYKNKKKRGGAKGKTGKSKDAKQWENAVDENEGDQQPAKKKRAPRKAKEVQNPNLIKTSNKLIGEIENNDLYTMDDGEADMEMRYQQDDQ